MLARSESSINNTDVALQEIKMEDEPKPSAEPTTQLKESSHEGHSFLKTTLPNGDQVHMTTIDGYKGRIKILEAGTLKIKNMIDDAEWDLEFTSLTDQCLMTYGQYRYPDINPHAVFLGGPPRTHKIKIWDLKSSTCIKELDTGEDNAPRFLGLSRGRLAYASNHELIIFNVTTLPIVEELKWSCGDNMTIYKILGESNGNLILRTFDQTISLNMKSKEVKVINIDSKTPSILVLKNGSILATIDKGSNVLTQVINYNAADHKYDVGPRYCLGKPVLVRNSYSANENYIFPFQNNVVIFRTNNTLEAWDTSNPNQTLQTVWEFPEDWRSDSITLNINPDGKLNIKGVNKADQYCETVLDEIKIHSTKPLQNTFLLEENPLDILEETSLLKIQKYENPTFYEHTTLANGDFVSISLVNECENKIVITDKKSGQEKFVLQDNGNNYQFILCENNQLLSLAYYSYPDNVKIHRIKYWDLNTQSCINTIEHSIRINSRALPRERFVYFNEDTFIIRNTSDKTLPRELLWKSDAGIEDIVGESHNHLIVLTKNPHNLIAINLLTQKTTLLKANPNQKYAVLPQSGTLAELTRSDSSLIRLIQFDRTDQQFKTAITITLDYFKIDNMQPLENDRLLFLQGNSIFIWDPKYVLQHPQILWTNPHHAHSLELIKPLENGQLYIQTKLHSCYERENGFFNHIYQLKALGCFLEAKTAKSNSSNQHTFWKKLSVDSSTQYDLSDLIEPDNIREMKL